MSNARNLSDIVGGNFDIPAGSLDNAVPANGSITTAKLADDAVTSAKIADDAVVSAALATDAVGADALSSSAISSGDLPAGSVLQFKKAVTQNPSTTIITASGAPAVAYGANKASRTYSLAQTITITPGSTSSLLYCMGNVGWTSMSTHSTGAHGTIITLNDTSSIDNSDYPWYSESQYVSSGTPYWPADNVLGTFAPNTTSQVTIRLRPYAYRETGTKTAGYQGSALFVMEIAQ